MTSVRLTPELRATLRRLIDERRRELVPQDRCLDAASQTRYRNGCRCEDCRKVASAQRYLRRYGTPEAAARSREYERERWHRRKKDVAA